MEEIFPQTFKNEAVPFSTPEHVKKEQKIIEDAVKAASGRGPWTDVEKAQAMWWTKWKQARVGHEYKSVKILSQNMFCLPAIPRFGLSQHKNMRIEEFSRSILPKYDIHCLQEVFYLFNDRKERLSHIAQLAGFPF